MCVCVSSKLILSLIVGLPLSTYFHNFTYFRKCIHLSWSVSNVVGMKKGNTEEFSHKKKKSDVVGMKYGNTEKFSIKIYQMLLE